ncbi:2687_t:CDS:2, partial [Acaulospora colombiana]
SLNIWDALAGESVLHDIHACSQYLPHLEVLQLNIPSLDGPDTSMTTLSGHAVQPPYWTKMCPPEDVHPYCDCVSCTLGIFEEEERRALCEEWVETEWIPYHTQAFALIKLLPKLKLFEWFLVDFIEDYITIVRPRLVFWEWKITREENTAKVTVKQNIRGTPYDELFEDNDLEYGWSLTRGFSCDQDDNLAERLRNQS